MVKKFAIKSAVVAASLALCAPAVLAQSVSVTVNGHPASLEPAPIDRGGRVFVPLRGVFERLGASVVYDNGQINAQGKGRAVSLRIGSTNATVNGENQTLDVAPFIVGASTYVPLRFVAESLGAAVNWDNSNRIVAIVAPGVTTESYNPPNGGPPNEVITPQPQAPSRSPIAIAAMRPPNNTLTASARPTIEARFTNGVADANTIRMNVDGADVTADATRSANGVVYSPPSDLLAQRHNVRVVGRDARGRPFDLRWTFTSGSRVGSR